MLNKKPKWRIAKVLWTDACDFISVADSKKQLPIRESIGYVIRNDKECICLLHLRDIISDKFMVDINDDESGGIAIPKNMIIKIVYLKD